MNTNAPIEIGILLYPEAQLSAVLGITDLFEIANRLVLSHDPTKSRGIRVSHWSLDADRVTPIRVFDMLPDESGNPTVMVLPPTLGEPATAEISAPYADWLRAHHKGGGVLASVCAGAFLLAETGLLAGRPATTHWLYTELFRERFPEVNSTPIG